MAFLYNLFGRKQNSQSEQSKYDRITFQINLSDNIPQFFQSPSERGHQQRQLTPDHPLYYQIFAKKSQDFIEYETNQNDTIFGIAIKLNISEKKIKQINGVSGNIYPGMRIKLPEGTDISPLLEKNQENHKKMRISQILSSQHDVTENQRYVAYYNAGVSGQIKGTLTINPNYVIFNPLIEDQQNIPKFNVEKLLKFNAIIETSDIQQAIHIQIPEISQFQSNQDPKMNSILQFMLYKVGNPRIQDKYKERLKQLKIDHKAIASISFSVRGAKSEQNCEQIVALIKKNVQSAEKIALAQGSEQQKKRLTNIPFFDIIHENINPRLKQQYETQKKEGHKILSESAILGELGQQSSIVSKGQFANLVTKLPMLYQLYNWNKVYSCSRDGTSFNTFLNKTKGQQPMILLIKEYKGYLFGAFLVQALECGKTGRGQMFVFTFKDGQKPQVYEWTTKNQFFVYLTKDQGLGIGMGASYAIFIKKTMDKGSSSSTVTFGNKEPLSLKEDFQIDQLEFWTIDSGY